MCKMIHCSQRYRTFDHKLRCKAWIFRLKSRKIIKISSSDHSTNWHLPATIGFKHSFSFSNKFSSRSLIPHSPFKREFRVIAFSWKFADKFSIISSFLFLPLLKFKSNLLTNRQLISNHQRFICSHSVHDCITLSLHRWSYQRQQLFDQVPPE